MLLFGAGTAGDSVSAGSRGTVSKLSASGSSDSCCLSHWASAAALAAPASILEAGGTLGVSTVSEPPLTILVVVSISVNPACATVGSVSIAVVSSTSGAAAWD